MKLVDLITLFRQGETLESFCRVHSISPESEVIEIFAQVPVSLDSQLRFFPIEESRGRSTLRSEGNDYQSLFDFFYFLEVIEDVKGSEVADAALALQLYSYATKDA